MNTTAATAVKQIIDAIEASDESIRDHWQIIDAIDTYEYSNGSLDDDYAAVQEALKVKYLGV